MNATYASMFAGHALRIVFIALMAEYRINNFLNSNFYLLLWDWWCIKSFFYSILLWLIWAPENVNEMVRWNTSDFQCKVTLSVIADIGRQSHGTDVQCLLFFACILHGNIVIWSRFVTAPLTAQAFMRLVGVHADSVGSVHTEQLYTDRSTVGCDPSVRSRLKVNDRSFTHRYAPVLWNSLQRQLRQLSAPPSLGTATESTPLLALSSYQFHSKFKTVKFASPRRTLVMPMHVHSKRQQSDLICSGDRSFERNQLPRNLMKTWMCYLRAEHMWRWKS